MSVDKLIAALEQIRAIAEEALQQEQSKRKPTPRRAKGSHPAPVEASTANKLPEHILRLRDEGFFNPPKTASETHAKLQPVYSCDLNRVAVALLRLRGRKQLRKTSKVMGDKKQVAYGW
jgi:hypothetical protein